MMRPLNIVITGGSSGLGLALAKKYAEQGHNIGLIARNQKKLDSACQSIKEINDAITLTNASADLGDETAAIQAINDMAATLSGIDIVINSAGVLREGYFEDISLDTFKQVMNINLFGIVNVSHAALPYLKASQGQLVNIASMAAFSGVFGYTPYCASKHALAGFTESLRYELEPQGITVQLICPPEFDSPMVDELNQTRTPENLAHVQMIPVATTEAIAQHAMAGIEAKRYLTITGWRAQTTAFFVRHFPTLTRKLADNIIRKVQRQN